MTRSESTFRWAVRLLGLGGVAVVLVSFALGREVPFALIVLVGGMIGLDPIVWSQRKVNNG